MPTAPTMPDAVLLAAGLGTRLRPLTDTLPKPLVPVAGKPLIDRIIDSAIAEGVGRFVVNAHYRADQLEAHVPRLAQRIGRPIAVSREAELLDTGGGVKQAMTLIASDPVLVMNTDAFWPAGTDIPLTRMLDLFAERMAEAVLLCVPPYRATGFARSHDFCLGPDRRISTDTGAPVIYAGVALVSRSLFATMPDGPFSLLKVFDLARERDTLFGSPLAAPWHHVGDASGLAQAEVALVKPQ